MTMDKARLVQALLEYDTPYREESRFVPRFLSLLNNFGKCYERSMDSGHITCSSFITDNEAKSVLLVYHKKLEKWLQPGGHADADEHVLRVATREAIEETGLKSLKPASSKIFDIDIHTIPTHNGIGAHAHYDVRFLFTADRTETIRINHESHDAAWIPAASLGRYIDTDSSIHRMWAKVEQSRIEQTTQTIPV